MFTGIIREIGEVVSAGARLSIKADAIGRLRPGDSLAVDGVCLTLNEARAFDVVPETMSRTTLGGLVAGARVNLEPALAAGEPMGGHFVQGHVDGTGVVESLSRSEDVRLVVRVDPALARGMVSKGPIAVDGVSLTLVDVAPDRFSVALVPFTLDHTTLGARNPGDPVNIELDLLGKYARRPDAEPPVDMDLLRRAGFLG